MENDSGGALRLNRGFKDRVYIETGKAFFDSSYASAYQRAFDLTEEIVKRSQAIGENQNKDSFKNPVKKDEDINNIIAFVGDRGAGKSSIMISFIGHLIGGEGMDTQEGKSDWESLKELKKFDFKSLSVIDPTLFEEGESMLRHVIAKLFLNFKKKLKEDKKKNLQYEKNNGLISAFQEVYEGLKMISLSDKDLFSSHKHSESSLEALGGQALGSNLREKVQGLITKYLTFMAEDDCGSPMGKRFLVIPIDDLDMNISQGYPIMEEIRRYLMIPNLIVVMALRFEQLRDTVEQEFAGNFDLMHRQGKSIFSKPEIMTEKYLNKLIPMDRRIKTSSIQVEVNRILEYVGNNIRIGGIER